MRQRMSQGETKCACFQTLVPLETKWPLHDLNRNKSALHSRQYLKI